MNQPIPFVASTAEAAVAQIRSKLGPSAIVLNVRPLPANGIARLWQKPMIEVLAYLPEANVEEEPHISATLAEFREQLNEIRQQVERRPAINEIKVLPPERPDFESPISSIEDWTLQDDPSAENSVQPGRWRVGALLQRTGLLPLHAQSIIDELQSVHGEIPPISLEKEIKLTSALLAKKWVTPRPVMAHSRHVLVGPSGSGKTTSLCKWLTQASLVEGRSAHVWRLDGATANMAESLSVYCEILGATVERLWQTDGTISEDIGFIDLPGVDWRNPAAIAELGKQLRQCGSPHVHLVLNGAYDTSILLAQLRAFSVLPIEDLIITHLDEESRWGKIWNLTLGSNYSIRYFSTGQNIPGDFCAATAESILSRNFLVNKPSRSRESTPKSAGKSSAM